jgi:hypothetical protein
MENKTEIMWHVLKIFCFLNISNEFLGLFSISRLRKKGTPAKKVLFANTTGCVEVIFKHVAVR